MSLSSLIRGGVATIHNIINTGGLECVVQHAPWLRQVDGFGTPEFQTPFGVPIERRALLVRRQQIQNIGGQMVMTQAYLAILEPIPEIAAVGRANPVDPRDMFILPDGMTGPIVHVNYLQDGETNRPFLMEIYLGRLMLPTGATQ